MGGFPPEANGIFRTIIEYPLILSPSKDPRQPRSHPLKQESDPFPRAGGKVRMGALLTKQWTSPASTAVLPL